MKKAVLLIFLSVLFLKLSAQDSISGTFIKSRFSYDKLYIPAALMLSGVLCNGSNSNSPKMYVASLRNTYIPNFSTRIDDYLQFSPIILAYGLDAFGVRSKNNFGNRTLILAKSEILVLATTQLMKNTLSCMRPDGSSDNAFPSGHTTQAFAAATFLSEEYKDLLPWMPYLAYIIASSVGVMRIANNKHYMSDVLFGAGLGILCVKIPYWTHKYRFF